MKKNQILSYVVMGCALLAILGLFLPYVSIFGQSVSLWKAEYPSRVLVILFSLIVPVVYLLNKKTELSYLTSGGLLFSSLEIAVSNKGLDNLSIGFYLIILASIAICVITYLYDEKEGKAIINFNRPVNNQYQQPQYAQQPIQPQQPSFDPQTGEPLNNNINN